tara:strand:+ start:1527 stop:1922 length:396 start_codon:yes stop_codon:yes gene_type:complete
MPQLDLYIAMSQVFWFTLFFVIFYLVIVRDILPVIARSIKLRKKKVGVKSESSFDDEAKTIIDQTAITLDRSLNDSRSLLTKINTESLTWLDSSIQKTNESLLLDVNKIYIQRIAELKGRSFLIEEIIKKN